MRYADYDTRINTIDDLEKYKKYFENDIANKQRELEEFIERAIKRIEWINECERTNNYCILGSAFKDGRNKSIAFIIRYPDGTSRTERYTYTKVAETREKINELKEIHSGVDWSKFTVEI